MLFADIGDAELFLVAIDSRNGFGGRHRGCVGFRLRSPEVVQLYQVIDSCNDVVLRDSDDAWLMIDVAALRQPIPVHQQRPCALSGGFQMRVSGIGTGSSDRADFRKCGSFVEMRLESDCSGEMGMYFDFQFDICVPEGLFMYAKQRTLCVANWTSGPYTFTLLRHDVLPYTWIFRFQTSLEESFVAYLFSDLIDDVSDLPTVTLHYFRFDMVRSAAVPVTSLCVDESEICANVVGREFSRCETETGNETSTAAPALTCPRACGLCNATRPAVCEFSPEMVGMWHDGVNISDAEFQLQTAANRKSVDIVTTTSGATVKQRFYCIQWEATTTSGKRPTHGIRFSYDEFLLVNEPTGGCRRRYACVWVLLKSASVMYFRLSRMRTWPFTSLTSDSVDCSRFDSDARFRVLISRERRDLARCHLPTPAEQTNYSVTFRDVDFSCDATVVVEPETRDRLRLTLIGCASPSASVVVSFGCLDSMLAPPYGDVILVTNVVTSSTSGPAIASPTLGATSSAKHANKFRNRSSFWTGERWTTAPMLLPTSTQFMSESSSLSSLFHPDSVHCWLFLRLSFPHEFHIFPGTQCDRAAVTSDAGRRASATFVKKRIRSARLFAADQPVSLTSPKPEILTSGRPRDSRQLSALGRDTEQRATEHETAEINHQMLQRQAETNTHCRSFADLS